MTKLWLPLILVSTLAAAGPKSAARLDNLPGSWKGTGSLTAGKDHVPLTFDWACTKTSAAAGVLCTLEIKGMPAPYAETVAASAAINATAVAAVHLRREFRN